MQTKLDVSCDVKAWTGLSQLDRFKLQLIADNDVVFFWEDPRLGNIKLWPSQKEILAEFNRKTEDGKRKYKELLFSAGMRSSKTTIAALIILTEMYKMLMMDSPQLHYELLPKEEIVCLCTASTEKQCHRTIFKKVVAFIESSPFFCSFADKVDFTTGRLKFPKNLVILGLGSNLKSNVGLTVKCFVAEEINFTGEETYKVSPADLYNRLSKSTTTFKPFGEDVKVAISSQADGADFLSKRIELVKEQKLETTLTLVKTSLEMNPNLTEKDLDDERLMDEDSYSNDYGFGARRSGSSYFKQVTIDLYKNWKRVNIFDGEPKYGLRKPFTPDLRIERLEYDKYASQYGIFSDPASIGDGFGLTLAHLTINNEIILDGVTVFKPGKGQEINPQVISDMISKIIKKVPVEFYAYDIYMYNELRQDMVNLGINTVQHQLRIPDWEALKERINTKRIHGPYMDYLEREFSNLKLMNNRVDHSTGGSKDMADSICQTVAYWDDPKKEEEIQENQVLILKGT